MKPESSKNPLRVGMISLGCAKNLVDSEIMLGTLLKDGMEITNEAAQADVVIVNTCSFIDSAQEESVETILESAQVREATNRGQGLIVAGCLPQRFRDELPKLLPEVDAFMGIDQVARVTEIVREAHARRKAKVQSPKSKVQSPKPQVSSPRSRVASLKSQDSGLTSATAEFNSRITHLSADSSAVGLAKAEASAKADHASRITHQALPSSPTVPLLDVHLRPNYIPDYATPRFRLTPRHFAYVKIAEGQNCAARLRESGSA